MKLKFWAWEVINDIEMEADQVCPPLNAKCEKFSKIF